MGQANRLTDARPEGIQLLKFFGCRFDPRQHSVQILTGQDLLIICFRQLIALCGDSLNLLPKLLILTLERMLLKSCR
ncbi:hypothetical protein ACETIH_01965 [Microvirga arabica]|uniref:Uncharacterized protein n=1 Tax=Microvirga arabica TaxID=1128671 RepID=A0ABV6Y2M6_9HYPH